jgi:hypothetical protein
VIHELRRDISYDRVGDTRIVQRLDGAKEKVSTVCTIIISPMNGNISKIVVFQHSSFGRLIDNNPEEEKEPNMYRQEDAAKAPRLCGWSFDKKNTQ